MYIKNRDKYKWPPCLAWTYFPGLKSEYFFVAFNYGVKNKKKFVNMISILNNEIRFFILWEDLKNNKLWRPGWLSLSEISQNIICENDFVKYAKCCNHPSEDSGFNLSVEMSDKREWGIN